MRAGVRQSARRPRCLFGEGSSPSRASTGTTATVMATYEPHCDGVFECWNTKQLEGFVNAIADNR